MIWFIVADNAVLSSGFPADNLSFWWSQNGIPVGGNGINIPNSFSMSTHAKESKLALSTGYHIEHKRNYS